jgi:UDP-hydrolysing UDP-N-acetyl-D-glucosamine 2-epimerase
MTRIISISSDRADLALLAPVWETLATTEEIDLHIVLTGSHTKAGANRADIAVRATVHTTGADLGGTNGVAAASASAEIVAGVARIYDAIRPDLVMIAGDRLDMIPAAIAALPFNLPLAHVQGGEDTPGAIDGRIRHALTKLSHVHFAPNTRAAKRLTQMGEEAWRIHVTGSPSLDALAATPIMTDSEFRERLGLDCVRDIRLVTVHPETTSADPTAPVRAILPALAALPRPTLFTGTNSDPSGMVIREQIDRFVEAHSWAWFRESLGAVLYCNVMRRAASMVGNSSSGIIEAALFGLPAINVGDRQALRDSGPNVINVRCDGREVEAALRAFEGRHFDRHSLYGDGRAAPRIAHILKNLPSREELLYKRFNETPREFEAPWTEQKELG